jgi:hypothetical protein
MPQSQFANYVERQPEFRRLWEHQPQDWFVQGLKKPPRPSHEFRTGLSGDLKQASEGSKEKAFEGLDRIYVVENRTVVANFIEENHLYGLLLQAEQSLNENFGDASIKTLSVVSDEEGFETLFCLITTSRNLQQSRIALRAFDRGWWLSRAKQAAGKLNFDFTTS